MRSWQDDEVKWPGYSRRNFVGHTIGRHAPDLIRASIKAKTSFADRLPGERKRRRPSDGHRRAEAMPSM
jgi:hypothetical protein